MSIVYNSRPVYLLDRQRIEFVRRYYFERDSAGHPIPGSSYHVVTTPGVSMAQAFRNPNAAARRAAILNGECGHQRYVVLDQEEALKREKHMSAYRRYLSNEKAAIPRL